LSTVGTVLALAGPVSAADVTVAVTSSFLDTMNAIAEEFQKATGHRVLLNERTTGELYAQILNQAPFDVFLAGDDIDPKTLEDDGFAVRGSRFTYAVGRVTLWSQDPRAVGPDGVDTIRAGRFERLAIANPRTSANGQAAVQALKALGLWPAVQDKVLEAASSRQAFQWVADGKAKLGVVPLAEVLDPDLKNKGSRWDIPISLHAPIRQDAVLLLRGQANPAAVALMDYLRSPKARGIIERFGFGLP
jgi:molybdate transport system substrate-binding protein